VFLELGTVAHLAFYQPQDFVLQGFAICPVEMDGYHKRGGANPFAELQRLGIGVALRRSRTVNGYSDLHGVGSLL